MLFRSLMVIESEILYYLDFDQWLIQAKIHTACVNSRACGMFKRKKSFEPPFLPLSFQVLWVTALIAYASAFPQLRSVQLGGTGPRPVLLGTQPQGPTYSQQLTFGGQQPQQILAQNQAQRFQGIPGGQPQTTRPIVLQQGTILSRLKIL